MSNDIDSSTLAKNSPLFWFTLLIPLAIIGVGINFIINPLGASAAYGVAINDPDAFPYMWVKGIRDIFSGVVLLPFLLLGERRTTAIIFAIATIVPLCDGLVILAHSGFSSPIFIHWGTALYMIVVAAFLLRPARGAAH